MIAKNEYPRTEEILQVAGMLKTVTVEQIKELERENIALLKALKEIAAYGPDDGCCGYGCDTPSIAIAAIDAMRKEAKP